MEEDTVQVVSELNVYFQLFEATYLFFSGLFILSASLTSTGAEW